MDIALGLGLFGQQYGGSAVTPVSLTILAGSSALYSLVRASGYVGPCIRIVRASDSAETDIGFAATGFVDVSAATTFMGASTITVKTWYDQSGNANDAIQTTVGNQPLLNTVLTLYGYTGLFCGNVEDIFNGFLRYFVIPSGVSHNTQAFTALSMVAVQASGDIAPIFQMGPDGGTAFVSLFNRNLSVRPGIYMPTIPGFPVISPVPGPMSSGFTFAGIRGTTTNKSVFSTIYNAENGIYTSNTGIPAATGVGGRIGMSDGAVSCYKGSLYAVVIYPSALSDANVNSVKASFNAVWTPAAVTKTRALIYDGDSITEGYGSTFQQNRTRDTLATLNSQTIAYYNLGVNGRTAAGVYATRIQSLSYQVNIGTAGDAVILLAGLNDIRAAVLATDVWNNSLAPYITYAVSLGYNVAVGTLIQNTNLTIAEEAQRVALNAIILSSAAGVGASVIDYAADGTNVTLMDGTHPDNNGYAVMSARELPQIRTMLGL